jgi:hypothetical protein
MKSLTGIYVRPNGRNELSEDFHNIDISSAIIYFVRNILWRYRIFFYIRNAFLFLDKFFYFMKITIEREIHHTTLYYLISFNRQLYKSILISSKRKKCLSPIKGKYISFVPNTMLFVKLNNANGVKISPMSLKK